MKKENKAKLTGGKPKQKRVLQWQRAQAEFRKEAI
jgi:hypothetical protein